MYDTYIPNGLRPMEVEMIRAEIRGQTIPKKYRNGEVGRPDASHNFLTIRTGNDWLKQYTTGPAAAQLFGQFWYEHELCIMFADTNVGKSVLAVQIADSIAAGRPIEPFGMSAAPAPVLYIDFELSARQFEARYMHCGHRHQFAERFYRAEVNYSAYDNTATAASLVYKALEYGIKKTEAAVLVIDNITALRTGTEHAGEALSLMKHLKALKTRYNLSILVLAHTPKRKPGTPLSRNDLQGSKMLMNFADSAFAIGDSAAQPGLRYLKQVKQRYSTPAYGADNVCLCTLQKSGTFLHYTFGGNAAEAEHLHRPAKTAQQTNPLAEAVTRLHAKGLSQRRIANRLCIAASTVNGILKHHLAQ